MRLLLVSYMMCVHTNDSCLLVLLLLQLKLVFFRGCFICHWIYVCVLLTFHSTYFMFAFTFQKSHRVRELARARCEFKANSRTHTGRWAAGKDSACVGECLFLISDFNWCHTYTDTNTYNLPISQVLCILFVFFFRTALCVLLLFLSLFCFFVRFGLVHLPLCVCMTFFANWEVEQYFCVIATFGVPCLCVLYRWATIN